MSEYNKDFKMPEDPAQSRKERLDLIRGALTGEGGKRIPLISNDRTYKIFDAGYKLSEGLYDYDKMADAVYKYHERYQFDSYFDLGTRNRVRITDCFDAVVYDIDDEKGALVFRDKSLKQTPDVIMKHIVEKGSQKFIYEDILPDRFNVKDANDAAERIAKAGKELMEFNKSKGEVGRRMREEYGVPTLFGPGLLVPIEDLFMGSVIGIKDLAISMRRYKKEFQDFMAALEPGWKANIVKRIEGCQNPQDIVFQFNTPNLAHTVMNPKQFGEFYWPFMKFLADELFKHDYNLFIQGEGFMNIQFDFYRDLPDKHVAMLIEMNTAQEVKDALPNITVVGGFPTALLGSGTVEECIDKLKELLDTVGKDGRWMCSSDKMLSYPNDVKPENMKAVNDFIRTGGSY